MQPSFVSEGEDVIAVVAEVAFEKKASSAVALMVGECLSIVDWFVIVSAANRRQVRTIVEEMEKKLRNIGVPISSKEGHDTAEWVLLDCGDVVVHVMTESSREFYALERLWAGVPSRDLKKATRPGL
ncbi:MAG: ribosome silencing factor [Acidimicrobiia bacterium]